MRSFRKISTLFLFSILNFLLLSSSVFAENFVFVDWKVDSYSPENYSFYAKNPLLPGSTVKLTANFFKDTGKGSFQAVNLKDYTIRWLNSSIKIAEVKGTPSLSYVVSKFGKDTALNLSVQILDSSFGVVGQKQISIPIKRNPEITLHSMENGRVSFYHQEKETFFGSSGQEIGIFVKPYFFNVRNVFDLNFEWSYRLKKVENPEQNQFIFKAKLPQNKVTDLFSVFVQNSKSELEFVKKNFYLSNK